jgi:hypothetical protein
VDTTRRLLGAALWTGDGYARAHHTQVVDPDIVRSLDVGQAAYIYRGGVTYVQVKRLLAGAAAVVAPATERPPRPPALPAAPMPLAPGPGAQVPQRPQGPGKTLPDAGPLLDEVFGRETSR